MFGSKETAANLLLRFSNGHFIRKEGRPPRRRPAPKGFNYIGDGVSRTAFLERNTGLVYKIGVNRANLNEYYAYQRLSGIKFSRHLPFNVRIPRTGLITVGNHSVIVQEYAYGTKPSECDRWLYSEWECNCKREFCHAEAMKQIERWTNLFDMHADNALFNAETNTYWVIDMAT